MLRLDLAETLEHIAPAVDMVIGGRRAGGAKTEQGLKRSHGLLPAVVTEDELIEVRLELGSADSMVVGPVLDLMTFYADLFLAMHAGTLRQVGDHFQVPSPAVGSWADGTEVLVGEDAVDFEISLTAVDPATAIATLMVKHVPPAAPKIRIPADWMREPVADTSNNWVQVRRSGGAYVASVGQETFDVVLRIRLADGVMQSASMDNPVIRINRECRDADLRQCGDARPGRTSRRIEMVLEP